MNRIIILDEETAGHIAAGEVVERPVSVVKELIENSLDAGASQVTIEILDGGKSGLTVIDNGYGMSQEEVSLAFCRHATSKISSVDDLYSLSTLGFRGEALPSIAAVSHVVLKTRQAGDNAGYRIEVKGGEILSLQPVGCSPGTSVRVRDLFYNTPARRKHLKSKGTEAGLVTAMVQNMALTRPGVRFLLRHNKKIVFQTQGSDRLIDSISAVYGIGIAREMVPVKGDHGGININGLISKPALNRATRSYITIAVNGRYVRNQSVNHAISEAYSGLIPAGRHPVVVLNIQLSHGNLDVNIHPAKMEVRFDNEAEVLHLIKETLRYSLRNEVLVPGYKPRDTGDYRVAMPVEEKGASTGTTARKKYIDGILPMENPREYGEKKQQVEINSPIRKVQAPKEETRDRQEISAMEDSPDYRETQNDSEENIKVKEKGAEFPFLQVIGQLLPTYIIAAGPDGLYIMDQHAAHERIIFEKLLKLVNMEKQETQMLLTPLTLELDYKLLAVLQENLQYFIDLGFLIEEFGTDTYILRGVPAYLPTFQGVRDLTDLLEELSVMQRGKEFSIALTTGLACRAAIKSGEILSVKDMEAIVQQLSRTCEPYTCPHGRPTLVKITEQELAHMFKRTNQ
jgi:DNA mismatch repair protein MutL